MNFTTKKNDMLDKPEKLECMYVKYIQKHLYTLSSSVFLL